jgi:hypothetical protein
MKTSKQFIIDNYGENWLHSNWNPSDVMDAMDDFYELKSSSAESPVLPSEITANDIEKSAEEYSINNFVGVIDQMIIEKIYLDGIKWLRSQIKSQKATPQVSDEAYFCIESTINNIPVWWTGLVPHLSQEDSDSQKDMWTSDIHKARRYKMPIDASNDNQRFQINGIITEHLDISTDMLLDNKEYD